MLQNRKENQARHLAAKDRISVLFSLDLQSKDTTTLGTKRHFGQCDCVGRIEGSRPNTCPKICFTEKYKQDEKQEKRNYTQ